MFLALVLGSCSKVDFDEETVNQTFEDPIVHEVDCGSLTTTTFSGWDIDSETGFVETIAAGGNPPYAFEWADSTGSSVVDTKLVRTAAWTLQRQHHGLRGMFNCRHH